MEQGYFTLVLIAMINVVISLYYYLVVLKAAYMLKPDKALPELRLSPPVKVLATALIIAMLAVGIFPTYILEIAETAARFLG
jgi:NADH-quinone oxidoreductase subunit N